MSQGMITDVRTLVLDSPQFGANEAETLREILANDAAAIGRLREALDILLSKLSSAGGSEEAELHQRIGVVSYLLGRTELAVRHLQKVPKDGLGQYYLGRGHMALGRPREAEKAFERAGRAGFDETLATLYRAGALRAAGARDAARQLLESMQSSAAHTAEFHYQMGCLCEEEGEQASAIRYYEHALDIDMHHPEALFRTAFLNDLYGDDVEAEQLYKRCLARSPVYLGALFNLGVLYEDRGMYDSASRCFRRVLNIHPAHNRARLFLKDCLASHDMYLDEDAERRSDRLSQLLGTPVSDFELSVRSRNCLRKMNIRTLGDLARISETDLLNSKNFGETSLQEIQDLLSSRGLRIGMLVDHPGPGRLLESDELTQQEREAMARPIADMNLSVRARKCMARLGINTVGQLLSYTADQLLEVKNFGVTSLTEIRQKLGEYDLKLQGD